MDPVSMTDSLEKQDSAGTLQIVTEDGCPLENHPIKNLQTAKVGYYMILDFEAVCDEQDGKKVKYDPNKGNPQEIIEITSVIYSIAEGQITKIFHEFVKPQINTQLSPNGTDS